MKSHRAEDFKKLADTVKKKLGKAAPSKSSSENAFLEDAKRIFDELFDDLLDKITADSNHEQEIYNRYYEEYKDRLSHVIWTKFHETQFFLEYLGFNLNEIRFSVSKNNYERKKQEERVQKLLKSIGYNEKIVFRDFPIVSEDYKDEIDTKLIDEDDYELINEEWVDCLEGLPMSEEQFFFIKNATNDASIWEMGWYKARKNIYPTKNFKSLKYPSFWELEFVSFLTSETGSKFVRKLFDEIKITSCYSRYFILFEVITPLDRNSITETVEISIVNLGSEKFEIDIKLEMLFSFLKELGYMVDSIEESEYLSKNTFTSIMRISWGNKSNLQNKLSSSIDEVIRNIGISNSLSGK